MMFHEKTLMKYPPITIYKQQSNHFKTFQHPKNIPF
jgi:hypothetical protein